MTYRIIEGDALEQLATLDAGSVQTCITSPPYWGLRDYGGEGQLGLELTPEQYVANLVSVFREVKRVLRDDGTLWLNLGDSYYATTATQGRNENRSIVSTLADHGDDGRSPSLDGQQSSTFRRDTPGLKPKDLVGIPWMAAFALRADGWYLRSDIIWAKPNPMPESVTDRPTKAHEYLFLLAKSPRYFYDADAIREELLEPERETDPYPAERFKNGRGSIGVPGGYLKPAAGGRNKRSVWTVSTQPYPGAHFATFPPKLIEPCVLAGSPPGATVLDPFAGAGTTGLVALRHNRDFIGIELNPDYAQMARNRLYDDAPLFNVEAA